MSNVFTYYQTNKVNLLGGYMTYFTLSDAMNSLREGHGTVTAVTAVNAEWWHGKKMPYLCEILSSGIVYRQ